LFRIQIKPNLHIELLHLIHSHDLYALVNSNREHLRKWMSWIDDTKSVEDTNNFISRTMKQYANDLGFQVGIFYNNQLVGVSGFSTLNKANRFGELGYWLSKDFEGQGFMTKVNSKIIETGFENLALNKIIIHCATENHKSRAVAERLGFKKDGALRQNEWLYDHFVDHVVYSMLKAEYNIS
jgi:ribosomal-protein-serine acetyltransferase